MAWRRKPIQFITPILLFIAFLLLLLVSLSLPIIKSIYLFRVAATVQDGQPLTSIATQIRVGLWGYCAGGWSFAGQTPVWKDDLECYGPQVGFQISPVIFNLVGSNQIANLLLDNITPILIIHPISCGLTLLTAIPALIHLFRRTLPGVVELLTLLIGIIPTLVTTVDLVVDIVFVLVARKKIKDIAAARLALYWGPAVWMTAAATLCLWVGLGGLAAYACGCCGLGMEEGKVGIRKLRKRGMFVGESSPGSDASSEKITNLTTHPAPALTS